MEDPRWEPFELLKKTRPECCWGACVSSVLRASCWCHRAQGASAQRPVLCAAQPPPCMRMRLAGWRCAHVGHPMCAAAWLVMRCTLLQPRPNRLDQPEAWLRGRAPGLCRLLKAYCWRAVLPALVVHHCRSRVQPVKSPVKSEGLHTVAAGAQRSERCTSLSGFFNCIAFCSLPPLHSTGSSASRKWPS